MLFHYNYVTLSIIMDMHMTNKSKIIHQIIITEEEVDGFQMIILFMDGMIIKEVAIIPYSSYLQKFAELNVYRFDWFSKN